ncbi:MAG: PilZ domain-containing protein [Candidatus Tectomicrobia bacterium]|uniref:PilZ domain-containing protein n=1 Tax=Tectimicrobiota bacterium TaxID=2528274 RepID=A0A937VYM9_UNCTE|nr:PilZ domain-containing protein [Candidatus Tectomicrobia bacterium]
MFWKRRFPRLRKDFQITYRTVDREKFENDPISAMAINISGGGVCFEASEDLHKGALVALDIRSDDFGAPILALAKVVWCKAQRGGGYTVGAEFWWIGWGDKAAQNTIANYVAAQASPPSMSFLS